MQGSNVEEILDFAIEREQEAVDFYSDLATKSKKPAMQEALQQFAREEMGHKSRLIGIKDGKRTRSKVGGQVVDLKIAEYVVEEEPEPDMDYQSILILAMKKEKAAFRLYTELASQVEEPEIKQVLLDLAQDEARHKLRFEVEYDEHILREN